MPATFRPATNRSFGHLRSVRQAGRLFEAAMHSDAGGKCEQRQGGRIERRPAQPGEVEPGAGRGMPRMPATTAASGLFVSADDKTSRQRHRPPGSPLRSSSSPPSPRHRTSRATSGRHRARTSSADAMSSGTLVTPVRARSSGRQPARNGSARQSRPTSLRSSPVLEFAQSSHHLKSRPRRVRQSVASLLECRRS